MPAETRENTKEDDGINSHAQSHAQDTNDCHLEYIC